MKIDILYIIMYIECQIVLKMEIYMKLKFGI